MFLEEKFDQFKTDVIDRLARIETQNERGLERLAEITEGLKEHDRRLNDHDRELSHMRGESSLRGSVAGFLSALFVALFGWLLKKI